MTTPVDLKTALTESLEPYYGKNLTKQYVWAICNRTQSSQRAYQMVGKLVFNYETKEQGGGIYNRPTKNFVGTLSRRMGVVSLRQRKERY